MLSNIQKYVIFTGQIFNFTYNSLPYVSIWTDITEAQFNAGWYGASPFIVVIA